MMRCGVRGAACAVLVLSSTFSVLSSVPGAAQGRISNAKTETRSAAQGLEREVRAASARPGVTWIGYRDADGRRAAADVLLRHDLRHFVLGRHVPPRQRRRGLDEHRRLPRSQRSTDRARAGDRTPRDGAPRGRHGDARAHVHARLRHRRDRDAAGLAQRRQARREHRLAWFAGRRVTGIRRSARSRRQDGDERGRDARRRGRGPRARGLRRPGKPGVAARGDGVLARQRTR